MKTREQMERSATYLAYGHEGRNGLDPQTVEYSLWCIGNWKKYFVQYMKDKVNLQVLKDTGKEELLGEVGAAKLADNIFRAYYDNEVRAFLAPTQGQYCEREPAGMEFGELEFTDHHDAMNRDDNRTHWKQVQVSKVNTPYQRKQTNYAYLLRALIHRPKKKNKILLNAKKLVVNGAITWGQFNKLAAHSQSMK